MSDRRHSRFPNLRFLPLLLMYAVLIAYASTIVGPGGLNYVPLDQDTAWQKYLAGAFVWIDNGSDQRADWMGNLCMLIPFGFLATACLSPRRGAGFLTVLAAILLGASFVLVVKYAQIYFPPRTVTLNYVVAQISGAVIGIGAFTASQSQIVRLAWRRAGGGRETLRSILILYAAALFFFMLMPLDFALSLDDLSARAEDVPKFLFTMPAAERPRVVQVSILAASTLGMVPFGFLMVLAPRGRNRMMGPAMARGLIWVVGIFLLSCLLLSGVPTIATLVTRIVGLAIGIRIMPWAIRKDPDRLRAWIARWSLLAIPPYLVLLIFTNGLASSDWLSFDDAYHAIYGRGVLPLFNYYIVSKAQAAKNIVAHAIMFVPVGFLAWARGWRAGAAFIAAIMLSAVVEGARFFRPTMQGDINDIAVAGLAALLTAAIMPSVWRMLESVTLRTLVRDTHGLGWRERAAAARLRGMVNAAPAEVHAEVEHY